MNAYEANAAAIRDLGGVPENWGAEHLHRLLATPGSPLATNPWIGLVSDLDAHTLAEWSVHVWPRNISDARLLVASAAERGLPLIPVPLADRQAALDAHYVLDYTRLAALGIT